MVVRVADFAVIESDEVFEVARVHFPVNTGRRGYVFTRDWTLIAGIVQLVVGAWGDVVVMDVPHMEKNKERFVTAGAIPIAEP